VSCCGFPSGRASPGWAGFLGPGCGTGRGLPDRRPAPGKSQRGLEAWPAPAGRDDTLFSDDAVGLIHQTSCVYPRAVNNLALQALVDGFGADKAIVDESSTRTAIAEVTADW